MKADEFQTFARYLQLSWEWVWSKQIDKEIYKKVAFEYVMAQLSARTRGDFLKFSKNWYSEFLFLVAGYFNPFMHNVVK